MSAAIIPDDEALGELERRLSEAKEADRDLDLALYCLQEQTTFEFTAKGRCIPAHSVSLQIGGSISIPEYTSSVDAALALVSRTLEPLGFVSWGIDGTLTGYASAWVAVNKPVGLVHGYAPIQQTTPALAMCLALVRALKAKVQP